MKLNSSLLSCIGTPRYAKFRQDISAFLSFHADQFGKWVSEHHLQNKPTEIPTGNTEWEILWRKLAAEEILLAHYTGIHFSPALADQLAETRLFGDRGPTLQDARKKPGWVATIPLDRPEHTSGSLIRIWGLSNFTSPTPFQLEGSEDFSDCSLWLGGLPSEIPAIHGKSWQLGARLAARCLEEQRRDIQILLACQWIVTGEMANNRIKPVTTGNKLALTTTRQWLLPEGNIKDVATNDSPLLTYAATLENAWAHISNEGTITNPDDWQWPETPRQIDTCHLLCSKAIEPILAPALALRPARIVLWHSNDTNESKLPAQTIADILTSPTCQQWKGWEGSPPEISFRSLPSDSLPEIEHAFRNHGLANPAANKRVVINITGGNMLMKLAAIHVSQLSPYTELIYRDFKNYTVIHHRKGRSYSKVINSPTLPGIFWDFVLKGKGTHSPPSPPNTEDYLRKIFQTIA